MSVIMEPMFPRMVAKTITPTTWLPMLVIMESMLPTMVAMAITPTLPGCSHVGDHGANVSYNGGKDNHSHYLAAPMLVIMEIMFPTMVAKSITPTTWLLPC
jgi:hypothetical protein